MEELKVGDKVRCIKEVIFRGGHKHIVGQIITVHENNIEYWNHPINKEHYEVFKDE